jgi:IS30 family transposase
MLKKGFSQSEIARTIGKDKSVICREIKRNGDRRGGGCTYNHDLAQRKCLTRYKEKKKNVRLTPKMQEYIIDLLENKYSPEQIKGLSDINGVDCVSHERIYQMIWLDKKRKGKLHTNLRNQGRPYGKRGALKDKRGRIPNRRDISERPSIVEERERFGDLEIDTIIGKNHKGAIVTINDRATGILRMKKLSSRSSEVLAKDTIKILRPWKDVIKTITSDNGHEFKSHEKIAKSLQIDFYFARPYHSWERGSNENLNRLIRQYIPKGTDFSLITNEFIKFVEGKLNNRPRKRFGYLSPNQMLNQNVAFKT